MAVAPFASSRNHHIGRSKALRSHRYGVAKPRPHARKLIVLRSPALFPFYAPATSRSAAP